MNAANETRMSLRARLLRAAALIALACAAVGLRQIEPGSLSWLPLRTSCGAITGLPCIFCGLTRATHHLLNGELGQALYLNWLAFPIAIVLLALGAKLVVEAVLARRFAIRLPHVRFTPPRVACVAAGVFALWLLQVSLAVAFRKDELLNRRAPLYSLFRD